MNVQPEPSEKSTAVLSNLLKSWHGDWSRSNLQQSEAVWSVLEWFGSARAAQYPLRLLCDTWLVIGGRGAGKTRVGAEWVNGLVRGLPPFSLSRYGQIALVGETYGDVREVMIGGPSGIASISRHDRPRYEVTRRRLLWSNGAVAQAFSAESPDGLRGPQFEAAWCDAKTIWASLVTLATATAGLTGLPLSGIDSSALTDTLIQAVTAISGLVAIFGRLSAKEKIG